jgi:hypothetical protein
MKNKKAFEKEDGPSPRARIIPNFLPPPEALFPVEDILKITLRLDRQSVDFYKERARRHGTKYQRMMREILKRYALHHLAGSPSHSTRNRPPSHRRAA